MPTTDIQNDVQSTLDSWQRGGSADVSRFVKDNPSVVHFKHLLLDLIYEELCLDHAAGKPLRVVEHARNFPEYQESICRLIEVHSLLAGGEGHRAQRIEFPKAGDVVAGLQIVSLLGQGTFSRVYLAKEIDVGDRRVVAKFATVLHQEAALLGKTPHPHIIPILRMQQVEDSRLQVICMPFQGIATLVDVLDVTRRLKEFPKNAAVLAKELQKTVASERSPISVAAVRSKHYIDFVLQLAAQIADALSVMHTQSIVHCDIKPSNILLSWAGDAIVLDFNLSKSQEQDQNLDGGTLAYMAPERLARIQQRTTDQVEANPAEDIYSLGVVLFELLSGNRSVASGSGDVPDLNDLLDEHRFDEWRHSPGMKIKSLIKRCLARNPNERPTATELQRELRRCLRPDQKMLRYCARHRQRVLLAAGAMLLTAGSIVAYAASLPSAVETAWTEGNAAFSSQQFDHAIQRFSDGIEAGGSTNFLVARGRSQLALEKYELAEADFKAALGTCQDDHERVRIFECLGYSQLLGRRNSQAAWTYERLLDLDPTNTAALNNIAFCYSRTARPHEGQAASDRAVELAPIDPTLRCMHAHVLLALSVAKNAPISPAAYEDVQLAKKAGKIPAYAALDAAIIVLSYDPSATDEALELLEAGVDQGLPRQVVQSQRQFKQLHDNTRFLALADRVPSAKSKGREWELAIPPSSMPLLGN